MTSLHSRLQDVSIAAHLQHMIKIGAFASVPALVTEGWFNSLHPPVSPFLCSFGLLQSTAPATIADLHCLLAPTADQACLSFTRQLLATQSSLLRIVSFPCEICKRWPHRANICLAKGQGNQ